MIILGIDPGTASTGYGVIKRLGSGKSQAGKKKRKFGIFKYIDCGVIKTCPSLTAAERLRKLHNELNGLIRKYQPETLVVERVFFFKNLKTVIPVSQAEGVILLSAARNKIPVCQFTPLQVKMVITGYGWAEKARVHQKIKKLLKLKDIPKPDDASDALAIALTYFLNGRA